MPWSIADSQYAPPVTWTNASDRASYERAFTLPPDQEQRIDQALFVDNPLTPREALRQYAPQTTVVRPPDVNIDTVLSGDAYQTPQMNFSDFSDTNAGMEGSMRNYISA